MKSQVPVVVDPHEFEPERHFYPRVLNAQIHPLVRYFLSLSNRRLAERYRHLNPHVTLEDVEAALSHRTRFFRWGGADLFVTTDETGLRRMVVIETNSCPSGQKSMPYFQEHEEQAGYRTLLERSFMPMLKRRSLPAGELAVFYDKNPMEATGYAAVLADLADTPVHLVPCHEDLAEPWVQFEDGIAIVRTADGDRVPIRAALRYVTQRPWTRIPPLTRTAIFNPVLACLAGGRNKLLAAKAYDFHNAVISRRGFHIHTPETIWDVTHDEVPLWVQRMGGVAVVKDPYSNAGQGVYTITSGEELEAFMDSPLRYDRLIVQGLIGNKGWSSRTATGQLYHVGTVPDRKGNIYVADLRFMIGVSPDGFFPVAIYARRARQALTDTIEEGTSSWGMLGTNLSVKRQDGTWDTEPERLLLMDSRDFNRLGVGLDDLINAYIQTVLAVTAIDDMAVHLVTKKGRFRRRFFRSLNPDAALEAEITNA